MVVMRRGESLFVWRMFVNEGQPTFTWHVHASLIEISKAFIPLCHRASQASPPK